MESSSIGLSSTSTYGYNSKSATSSRHSASSSRKPNKRRATFDSIPGAGKLKAIFHQHDADRNGTISREELAEVLKDLIPDLTEQNVSLLFDQIDVNNDGMIEYEEFIDWLMDDGIGPIAGNDTWFAALEAVLNQGVFLTSTGLCGRWSARRKKGDNDKRRETYSLLSCGVVAYLRQETRYSGGTCSVDYEEVSGFGEWHVKEGILSIQISVHVELCSGSTIHQDRLEREERRHEQWPISKFETQFVRTGVLEGLSEVKIMLAMFGEAFANDTKSDEIAAALADASGHTGKAAFLLHKRHKAEMKSKR